MSTNTELHLEPGDAVLFAWECEAARIPSGEKMLLPEGTQAMVTQTLGGDITLQLANYGGLVQVTQKNASVLYRQGEPKPERPAAPAVIAPATEKSASGPVDEKALWEVMKTCYDPEIPVNIVDLGLVYDLKIVPLPSGGNRANVKMTLTAMGCGMGPHIAASVQNKLLTIPGIEEAHAEIVWDPPWNQSMITDDGKKRLGIY